MFCCRMEVKGLINLWLEHGARVFYEHVEGEYLVHHVVCQYNLMDVPEPIPDIWDKRFNIPHKVVGSGKGKRLCTPEAFIQLLETLSKLEL